ncbi:MAG TPA: glycosyltransferase [Terracidiphilus sp.]|nr:glycosyltransferase [Terracidiphilus sp.]
MKICLVATFPPSGRQLNEYAFYIANELRRHRNVELTILADEISDYDFVTDENGKRIPANELPELEGFNLIRCWKFGSMSSPARLLNTIRKLKPDVVWYQLVYSTFATPGQPVTAFAGLSAPALTRSAGFYTHVTLHHIIEHVDFSAAGVRRERLFRFGAQMATRTLLRANSVSVLLPGYYQTLVTKYRARNVLLGTHGTFAPVPTPPDFSKRGNPDQRILAFGHWGTYKRLETLMEAFPQVLKRAPRAKLIVAGANHYTTPGYWESIRASLPPGLPVEFRGYVPEEAIPQLFQTASIVVLPYDSATGSSGPAHQACEFGVPIVSAGIPDFRAMAENEDLAMRFYEVGNANDLADQLVAVLRSPKLEHMMAQQNYAAAAEMNITQVVSNYLRWFDLSKCKMLLRDRKESPRPRFSLEALRQRTPASLQPDDSSPMQ